MDERIGRLVLQISSWIELSPDTVVEPKAAVTWLETIAYELAELPESDRRELAAVAHALADEARASGRDAEASFFDAAPDAMGFDVTFTGAD
jgi:hypothetical protein